jgi:prepilin-type N-terminal cleavage/methylation domain-containing protein
VTDRLQRQGGFTLVEMIVATMIGAIVMAAIFPVFLLLYRVETTWGAATQARATGLIAEDYLIRDVRAYQVVPGKSETNRLYLSGQGTSPVFAVIYSVEATSGSTAADCAAPTSPSRNSGRRVFSSCVLVRTVKDEHNNVLSKRVVAHGVDSLTASCSGKTLTVTLVVDGGRGDQIQLDPALQITPRNPNGCPA